MSRQALVEASLELAVASAAVSNYVDHVDHNEIAEVGAVRDAGRRLRATALSLSVSADRDLVELYADRLAMVEARNVLWRCESFDGARAAREFRDLRDLQLVQIEHDRVYHPDVIGLSKLDQLRHYALHIAKLAGATAEQAQTEENDQSDWLQRRLPDALLFGIKLSTVTGERLEPIPVEAEAGVGRPSVALATA